jgi:hypothetical protein
LYTDAFIVRRHQGQTPAFYDPPSAGSSQSQRSYNVALERLAAGAGFNEEKGEKEKKNFFSFFFGLFDLAFAGEIGEMELLPYQQAYMCMCMCYVASAYAMSGRPDL